jgi:dGTPase
MQEYGGFEHNLQSLRVVEELEERYAEFRGLNLTFEAREGILKHCSTRNARELGELGQRFLDKTQPSLEAQLTNLADEIAYNSHDVDDGLRAGLIDLDQLAGIQLFQNQHREVSERYPTLPQRRAVHEVVRRLIDCQVTDLIKTSQKNIDSVAPTDIEGIRSQNGPLIAFSEEMRTMNLDLKRFLREHLYRHFRVHRMTVKAARVVGELFQAFFVEPRLMPEEAQQHAGRLKQLQGETGQARAVADYIAGMTDRYAIREHERIFNPAELT